MRDREIKTRGRILFGLSAIGGLGAKAVQAILDARADGGRFRDIYDFCERVDLGIVNKAAMESLVKSGAFDCTGAMRRALMEGLPGAMEHGQAAQRDKRSGQMSMFGGDMGLSAPPPPPISSHEWTESEMLLHEKQTLGFYITKHPLTQHAETIRRFGTVTTADIKSIAAGMDREAAAAYGPRRGGSGASQVIIGALISQVRNIAIRNGRSAGKKMVVILLEDLVGSIEAIVFPDDLPQFEPLLRPDTVVFVTAEIDVRREEPCLRVGRITPIDRAARELSDKVVVYLKGGGESSDDTLRAVHDLCASHRGRCDLHFKVTLPDGRLATIDAGAAVRVDPSTDFLARMESLIGPTNIRGLGG